MDDGALRDVRACLLACLLGAGEGEQHLVDTGREGGRTKRNEIKERDGMGWDGMEKRKGGGFCLCLHLPGAEAVDAGVVVAVEEDGIGRGDRLQARHHDARGIEGRCYGPADIVEHQVGRRDIARGALGDGDVFVLRGEVLREKGGGGQRLFAFRRWMGEFELTLAT